MTKSRDNAVAQCIYHADTESFKSVLCWLRKVIPIPRQLLKRAAMAVCSCRKPRPQRLSSADLDLFMIQQAPSDQQLMQLCENQECSPADRTSAAFVKDVLREANTTNSESAKRFICLLKMALIGDFSMLEAESVTHVSSGTRPEKPEKASKTKPGKQHFSETSLRCFLQKRKRQAGGRAKTLEIPLFGGNMHALQELSEIGQHFSVIGAKYKPCIVQADYAKSGAMMDLKRQKSCLKIWCRASAYPKLAEELRTAAIKVQASSTKQYEQRAAWMRAHRGYHQALHEITSAKLGDFSVAQVSDPYRVKEVRWEDFSKKQQAKERLHIDPHPSKKPRLRCYNCLLFSDEKTKGGDLKVCKFHPGFAVSGRWSCCSEVTENTTRAKEITQIHHLNGCQEGVHVWRYQTDKVGEKRNERGYCRHYMKFQ